MKGAPPLQELDGLLGQWDAAYANLLRAEWRYERTGCTQRPRHRSGCCGCFGQLPSCFKTSWLAISPVVDLW